MKYLEMSCSFIYLFSLFFNFRAHKGQRPFKCSECPATFRAEAHLVRHKEAKHNPEPKLVSCDICSKSFQSKSVFMFSENIQKRNCSWLIRLPATDLLPYCIEFISIFTSFVINILFYNQLCAIWPIIHLFECFHCFQRIKLLYFI